MNLTPGKCSNCKVDLEEVFPGSGKREQYKDALDIRFVPGFGQFIDGNQSITILLCVDCSRAMAREFPAVFKQLYENSETEGPQGRFFLN